MQEILLQEQYQKMIARAIHINKLRCSSRLTFRNSYADAVAMPKERSVSELGRRRIIFLLIVIISSDIHDTLTRFLEGPSTPGTNTFVDSLKLYQLTETDPSDQIHIPIRTYKPRSTPPTS